MKLNHRFMPSAMVISEQSIRFDFKASSHQDIRQFCSFIESYHGSFLEEVVPSMNTVTVFYRKKIVDSCKLLEELRVKWLEETDCEVMVKTRFIDVPVCYDERFSEDLPRVMTHTGLTRGEVIALHTGTSYTVYMIGFLPGFPYLGDLPTSLHVPRLAQPRLRVPKGTVGIGGHKQASIRLNRQADGISLDERHSTFTACNVRIHFSFMQAISCFFVPSRWMFIMK